MYGWQKWTASHPAIFWFVLILLVAVLGLILPVGPGFWAAGLISGAVWHERARSSVRSMDLGQGRASRRAKAQLAKSPPAVLPQGPHVLLPRGRKIQVTKEEHHLDDMEQLLASHGGRVVAATLHCMERVSSRSATELVQVRIDGQPVGELTSYMSEHFLPLIKACDKQNITVACHAALRGNQLKVDVVLDTTKAVDLSDDWIARHVPGSG